MPKRRNSFDDNHFLLKMHISVKEVNLGVNSNDNMKKVYENTYKMLFNGSANNNSDHMNHNKELKLPNGYASDCNNSSSYHKQNNNDLTSNLGGNFITNACCPLNQQVVCSFCEKIICVICCRICQCCQNKFCHLCSVLQYNSQDESAVCLSCM